MFVIEGYCSSKLNSSTDDHWVAAPACPQLLRLQDNVVDIPLVSQRIYQIKVEVCRLMLNISTFN